MGKLLVILMKFYLKLMILLQSLLRLKEPAVLLRCRKDDVHLVESILEAAAQEYAEKRDVHAPEIIVDHTVYLPPAPTHHNPHVNSWYVSLSVSCLDQVMGLVAEAASDYDRI